MRASCVESRSARPGSGRLRKSAAACPIAICRGGETTRCWSSEVYAPEDPGIKRQIEAQPQGVFQPYEPVCMCCAELRQPLGGERMTLLCVSVRIRAEAGFCSWKKRREWMHDRSRARAEPHSPVIPPASDCRIIDHVARHIHGRSKPAFSFSTTGSGGRGSCHLGASGNTVSNDEFLHRAVVGVSSGFPAPEEFFYRMSQPTGGAWIRH